MEKSCKISRAVYLRGNQYLTQRKSDPLAQLVLTVEGISKEMALQLVICVVVSLAVSGAACGTRLRPKFQIRVVCHRRPELLVQVSLDPDLLNVCDERLARAESCLLKKAYRVRWGRLRFNETRRTAYER